jgi:hypothetical protein
MSARGVGVAGAQVAAVLAVEVEVAVEVKVA